MLMQQRMMRLFSLLVAHPTQAVRTLALSKCIRLPGADVDQAFLKQLLLTMDSNHTETCQAAIQTILGTCIASDAPTIAQGIQQLLPNRRALQEIVPALQRLLPVNRQQLLPVVHAIIAVLATDPLTLELQIEIAMATLPWMEIAKLLKEAAATQSLHADAVTQACRMAGSMVRGQGPNNEENNAQALLEEELAASDDERLRRIAVALLINQPRQGQGWPADQFARLTKYRADPSPLVAAAAQFTIVPETNQ